MVYVAEFAMVHLSKGKFLRGLRKTKYYIHLLQETHPTSRDAKLWLDEWGGEGVFAHGDERSRGVA